MDYLAEIFTRDTLESLRSDKRGFDSLNVLGRNISLFLDSSLFVLQKPAGGRKTVSHSQLSFMRPTERAVDLTTEVAINSAA